MFFFRTSYLPCEILWGHRFEQMQLYRKDNNKFEINFSAFHSTYEVDTPRYSANHLEHLLAREREHQIKKQELLESHQHQQRQDITLYVEKWMKYKRIKPQMTPMQKRKQK